MTARARAKPRREERLTLFQKAGARAPGERQQGGGGRRQAVPELEVLPAGDGHIPEAWTGMVEQSCVALFSVPPAAGRLDESHRWTWRCPGMWNSVVHGRGRAHNETAGRRGVDRRALKSRQGSGSPTAVPVLAISI